MSLLNEETRRKLRELNLGEMIDAIEQQSQDVGYNQLSFEDRMKIAVDYLYQKKYNSKVQRLIKQSKFRITNANYRDIYYLNRGLDQQKLDRLHLIGQIS